MAPKATRKSEDAVSQGYDIAATLRMTGVTSACLVRYERASVVVPLRVGRRRWYQAEDLKRIRKANRLERELGINLAGVEVVLRLTEQIADLQQRITRYETEGHTAPPTRRHSGPGGTLEEP
jgi:MerR family transcriptional regulator, heat shock protein HspR